MRNLIVAVLLGIAVVPSVPWAIEQVQNIIPQPVNPSPSPSPEPDIPVIPTSELAKLVPSPAERANLVTFFRDLANLLEGDTAGVIQNSTQLRNAQSAGFTLLIQQGRYTSNPALGSELTRRQKDLIGMKPDTVLTPQIKAQIAAFYRQIATELSQ